MRLIFKSFFAIFLSFFLASCTANDPITPTANTPTVSLETTAANAEKTYTTIEITGTVDDDGGDPVTVRGTVWSTDPNPSLSDSFTTETSASFTSVIEDLEANTTYYFKTYATNAEGTAYSNEESITTNSLEGTTWDFHVIYSQNQTWHGDVTFNADGTTVYDEPDYPGLYLTNGTWTLDGNDLTYDFISSEPGAIIYTGTLEGNELSGDLLYAPSHQGTWTAVEY